MVSGLLVADSTQEVCSSDFFLKEKLKKEIVSRTPFEDMTSPFKHDLDTAPACSEPLKQASIIEFYLTKPEVFRPCPKQSFNFFQKKRLPFKKEDIKRYKLPK